MRWTSTAIIVAILGILTASTAAAATPAQAVAANEAAVLAAIARGYAGYRTGEGEAFELSPDFDRAWNRAAGDEDMGADPICGCQDWDPGKFRYRVVSLNVNGSRAVANVDVDFGRFRETGESPWDHYRLTFARTPQGWRLDDLGDESDPSMKASMMRDKPGSWGQ